MDAQIQLVRHASSLSLGDIQDLHMPRCVRLAELAVFWSHKATRVEAHLYVPRIKMGVHTDAPSLRQVCRSRFTLRPLAQSMQKDI